MVHVLVTHMEMTGSAAYRAAPPVHGAFVQREQPDPATYLSLYRAVGGPVQWDERLRMPPSDLDALLRSPATHIYMLRAPEIIGFCEFTDVGASDIRLSHFGLVTSAMGKGLGSYLLQEALAACWAFNPSRIWLKTDTNDHPNAVRTYERAGFGVYLRQMEEFED